MSALWSYPYPERTDLAALTKFARRVVEERAILAIVDPAGELDAVRPLGRVRARYIALEMADIAETRTPVAANPQRAADFDERAILYRLEADPTAKAGTVQCPAHEDRHPSLSWRIADSGRVLLKCHAGCTFDEIRQAAA